MSQDLAAKEYLGEPTEHLPGTEGKIETMKDRASRRQVLFHPDDAKFDNHRLTREIKSLLGIRVRGNRHGT